MSAIISQCGKYRYHLTRDISNNWFKPVKKCLFIMLNPSTADATKDDRTIRRCINFAKSWGCTHLTVVNLFAFRATDPRDLEKAYNPHGPMNASYIDDALYDHAHKGIIVAAWGAHPLAQEMGEKLLENYPGIDFKCLGKTKAKAPRHPLYVSSDQTLESVC